MKVKTQNAILFKNKSNCIVDEIELEKAILWFQDKPTTSNKTIYLHGKYPCVSIHKNKIHVHRLLMSYKLNRKLSYDEHVHHINGNKLDARLENLCILNNSTHMSKHNKNKTITLEHKEKIRMANKKRRGVKNRRKYLIQEKDLVSMLKEGMSIEKISKEYGCNWDVIKARIKEYRLEKLTNYDKYGRKTRSFWNK